MGKISAEKIWLSSASKNKGKTSINNIFERLVKIRYGNVCIKALWERLVG